MGNFPAVFSGGSLFERHRRDEGVLHPQKHVRGALELVPTPVPLSGTRDDLDHGEPLVLDRVDDEPVQTRRVVPVPRATKLAPEPFASSGMLKDGSTLPYGIVVARCRTGSSGVLAPRHP